jgi:TonB-linked SusC/RagA family outer membrane protein
MSAGQYMNLLNDVAADRGTGPTFSEAEMAAIGSGTYWQDEIYRSAPISDYNFSVSGGVGKSRIYASLNYFNQDGVLKSTGQQKYIGRLNIDTNISDRTNIGFNINTSLILDDNGIDGVNTNESAGPVYASLLYDPTETVYNEDGTFSVSSNLTINNPMSLVEGVSSKSQTNRTMVNFFINYKILEGLTAKLNLGSDISNVKRDVYVSTLTNRGLALGGYADATSMGRSSYLAEYTMNYSKEINQNNRFDILGGITYQKFNFNVFNAQVSGFPSDEIETNNLSLGDLTSDFVTSNKEDNSLLSYLGRINYTIYNKILLTGSIRADGSSRFGANNKYGYFPSFAFGYKLSEEDFIPDFFEELKLRASWGQTGNQEIANYASLLTFGTGRFVYLDGSLQGSLQPLRIANPDLKWETTAQINVGVDARMMKGKINLTLDYFSKNTTDLLFNLPVPQSSGYSSILTNVGEVSNKGFEFLLNTTNISRRDFTWSSSINFTAIKNEVLDLGRVDQLTTGYLQVVGGNTAAIKVGSPLASYWGYEIEGIQQEGDPNPGYPKMKDQLTVDTDGNGIPDAGDGVINSGDATILGDPYPDFIYGINNQFKYKNWSLSFFIQGQQGGDLFNVMAAESMYPANDRRNRMTTMMDRWTSSNTGAKWPSATNPSAYPGGSSAKVNSLTVMDATYLRLKNAQINYTVPVEKIGFLSSLKVYITGQNLFTITDYPGYDPEANSFGRNNVKVDYASYPLARTFMLGLNATF